MDVVIFDFIMIMIIGLGLGLELPLLEIACVRGRMCSVLQDSIPTLRAIPNENKIHYQLLQL